MNKLTSKFHMAIERLVNSLAGYGVNEKNLSCFRARYQGDINFYLLRQIWRGITYTETESSGILHIFLASMNTSEDLALERSFGKLIKDGYIELGKRKIPIEELKSIPAEKAVSQMVSYGMRHKAMQTMKKRGYTRFPTGSGDLIRRIKALDRKSKDKFMELLDNPEIEIADFKDKGEYIAAVASFMQELYHRNTQKA